MRHASILGTIGRTPHVRIQRLFAGIAPAVEVWIKLERANPGASIKDRIALAMIEDAERRGVLKPSTTIIEPTSGNTGIGLAMVAAAKGYRIILVMPESMSVERRRVMTAFGARLVLTPREVGIKGSIAKAVELMEEIGDAWIPQQFVNPENPRIHETTTATEIVEDFPDGLDYLITGVGTGGHLTGVSHVLKRSMPKLKVLAVEAAKSAVISGGTHTPHKLQGISAGFIPGNLDTAALDGTVQVTEEAAFEYAQRAAKEEGIFLGISSGASLAAVAQSIPQMPPGSRVLTFCYDTGERYLSIDGLFG